MPARLLLDYVEFPSRDLPATQAFFAAAFGWSFVDYGPNYAFFAQQGLDGGCFRSETVATPSTGGTLLVLRSEALEATLAAVEAAGGVIVKPIFAFPGGRRFHFAEPGGNELAVWGDASG